MNLVPLFYASIISISSLISFFLSTQGMYINRTFLNMPLSIFEANVKNKEEEGIEVKRDENTYYFDKTSLNEDLIFYLNTTLKNRIDSYQLGVKYYLYNEGEFVESDSDYINAIKIRFKCVYYKNFSIDSSLSFYIKEGKTTKYE